MPENGQLNALLNVEVEKIKIGKEDICSIKCFNADYAMPYDEGSRG